MIAMPRSVPMPGPTNTSRAIPTIAMTPNNSMRVVVVVVVDAYAVVDADTGGDPGACI